MTGHGTWARQSREGALPGEVPPLTEFQYIERLELNMQLQLMIKDNHVIQHLDMPHCVVFFLIFFNFPFHICDKYRFIGNCKI